MAEYRVAMDDGATLYVKLLGDDSPGKPLLIAHHGAPGLSSHRETEGTFSFLLSMFKILVFDARGSGVSDLKPPYTHERWIADIEALRLWAQAEKFVLAGGSYGGTLALEYALAHQDKLLALILRDTFAWGSRLMMSALKNVLISDRVTVDPERQYRMWTGILKNDEEFAAGVGEMFPLFGPAHREGSCPDRVTVRQENTPIKGVVHSTTQNFAFSHNVPRYDVRTRLHEILVPTLVISGRQDVIVPLEFSEEISQGIPNAQLTIFDHSGHNPAHDEPEAFRDRVRTYLRGLGFTYNHIHS